MTKPLILPLRGKVRITSNFGWRTIFSNREWHQGADFVSDNLNIYASGDGEVVRAGVLGTYGNVVILKHTVNGKRIDTLYAHLASIKVKVGQKVKQGETVLGIMGNTGRSSGRHLHYEVCPNGWQSGQRNNVDPLKYVSLSDKHPSTSPTPSKDYSKSIQYKEVSGTKSIRLHTAPFVSKVNAEAKLKDLLAKKILTYGELFEGTDKKWRIQSGKYTTRAKGEEVAKKLIDGNYTDFVSVLGYEN